MILTRRLLSGEYFYVTLFPLETEPLSDYSGSAERYDPVKIKPTESQAAHPFDSANDSVAYDLVKTGLSGVVASRFRSSFPYQKVIFGKFESS